MTKRLPSGPYGVEYVGHNLPPALISGSRWILSITVRNTGTRGWPHDLPRGVRTDLAVYFDDVLNLMTPLPEAVQPGGTASASVPITMPEQVGQHVLRLEFLEQHVAWFRDCHVQPWIIPFQVTQAARDGNPLEAVAEANPWFYSPSQLVRRSKDGTPYPMLIDHAEGCRFHTSDGREYIDYVMGWGAACLGHANSRIRGALETALGCGNMLALPHIDEMKVTAQLCQHIPSAECVLFGKNGSDVCTAAIRMARAFTSRSVVLFSGYHGWHDSWVEVASPQQSSVPRRSPVVCVPFRPHDIEHVARLLDEHRGEVAAVMLEPAAQVEGVQGPVRAADTWFLTELARLTRYSEALLIFDEIFTGFRYPGGSVQAATGVIPDLSCFGKALGGGMPLAALVGRRDVFHATMASISYYPTYKGEAYAFAAASEALSIFRDIDVPGVISEFGTRLMSGADAIFRHRNISATLTGLPCRMAVAFSEPEEARRSLMRTLLIQELLRNGIFTFRGFLIPSLAHDDRALQQTLGAFEAAADLITEAVRSESLASYIEIPLVR